MIIFLINSTLPDRHPAGYPQVTPEVTPQVAALLQVCWQTTGHADLQKDSVVRKFRTTAEDA
jgi:hypothetical protein